MNEHELTNERDRYIKRVDHLKMVRHELNNHKGTSVDDAISTMTDEILSSAKHVRNINNILDDEELIEMLCD